MNFDYGYHSTPEIVDWNGDGKKDVVCGDQSSRVMGNSMCHKRDMRNLVSVVVRESEMKWLNWTTEFVLS